MRFASLALLSVVLALTVTAQDSAKPSKPADPPDRIPPSEYKPIADEPVLTARALDDRNALVGPYLVRYVLRQVDLTDEQHKLALEIMNSIYREAEGEFDERDLLVQSQQVQKLREEGKVKEADALEESLRASVPDPRRAFFESIDSHVNEQQKAQIAEARDRLEQNPSGALRPVDVFRAIQMLKLTPEQQEAYFQVKEMFRKNSSTVGNYDLPTKREFLQRLLARIYDRVLTPAQRKETDARIEKLRTDQLPGIERMDRRFKEQRDQLRSPSGRRRMDRDARQRDDEK